VPRFSTDFSLFSSLCQLDAVKVAVVAKLIFLRDFGAVKDVRLWFAERKYFLGN